MRQANLSALPKWPSAHLEHYQGIIKIKTTFKKMKKYEKSCNYNNQESHGSSDVCLKPSPCCECIAERVSLAGFTHLQPVKGDMAQFGVVYGSRAASGCVYLSKVQRCA